MAGELNVVLKPEGTDVRHYIIGAVGRKSSKTCFFQFGKDEISPRLIIGLQLLVICRRQRKRVRARGLQRSGGSHGEEIVDLADSAGNFRAGDAVTNAPTRNRIRL